MLTIITIDVIISLQLVVKRNQTTGILVCERDTYFFFAKKETRRGENPS